MENGILNEFEELSVRIALLDKFLNENTENSNIPSNQLNLMKEQINHMYNYRIVLKERILLIMKGK